MRWLQSRLDKGLPKRERSDLDDIMGPLGGQHRHDMSVIRQICGPFEGIRRERLAQVTQVLTTSTPPAISRRSLSSEAVLTAMMVAVAVVERPDVKRMVMAAQVIHALDLPSEMASELIVYASDPKLPRTLLYHLMHTVLGVESQTAKIVEAVLQGWATGVIRANEKGAQIYMIDATVLFMAHPRTLKLALQSEPEGADQAAYDALQAAGLASAVLPITVTTPEGSATFDGFLSRGDIWSAYLDAVQPDLQPMASFTGGCVHVELSTHPPP